MKLVRADDLFWEFVKKGQKNERGKYRLGEKWELNGAEIREVINSQPTIQPVIVRCKDCKHFESEYGYCDYYQWNMTGGDFCSKAEKREVTT